MDDIKEKKRRQEEFRQLVAMLPGKSVTARLMEVCGMLECKLHTAQHWHANSMTRVITQKHLSLLKKMMRYRKLLP